MPAEDVSCMTHHYASCLRLLMCLKCIFVDVQSRPLVAGRLQVLRLVGDDVLCGTREHMYEGISQTVDTSALFLSVASHIINI